MKDLQKAINQSGPLGSVKRLQKIAEMDLGERSVAAKRVLLKREKRLQLGKMMDKNQVEYFIKFLETIGFF